MGTSLPPILCMVDESNQPQLHPIRPAHIDTKADISNLFGSSESEETARLIVQYCQVHSRWEPFYYIQIRKIANGNVNYLTHGIANLVAAGYLVECRDGQYRVTQSFIETYAARST